MNTCKNCNHDCHCRKNSHNDDVGVCSCDDCGCKRTYKKEKDYRIDISFENEIKRT